MSNHLSHHHRYGMTVILETPFAGAFVSDIFGLSLSSPARNLFCCDTTTRLLRFHIARMGPFIPTSSVTIDELMSQWLGVTFLFKL